MRPEKKSQLLLGVTRSKAKMLEYGVPKEHHIKIPQDPAKLFTLSIGLLGDLAAGINRDESQSEDLAGLRNNLLFSARFFDAYLQSKLNEQLDPYLVLLGSASYYLCDLPGSAAVLANRIDDSWLDLDGAGLEDLLLWLLQANLSTYFEGTEGPFGKYIDSISTSVIRFFKKGIGDENLVDLAIKTRALAYESGTPRQLLFGDVIGAVLRKKILNSSWKSLPLYSGIPMDKWLPALKKKSFIKELWPAQHLLGQNGVLIGESAIVQMPTSAGKTKATELIIRSAFLAGRTSLVIIVAPFRALCHEIKNSLLSAFYNEVTKVNEMSDVQQTDFQIAELLGHSQILVVTPEKLLYVLRHAPELASSVGLIIFDEGHQFDSGTRGITYELLLTSLRSMLPDGAQKVLISAVISNAGAIGEWLNGNPKTVNGQNLLPTYRSIAFASFEDLMGTPVKTGWMKYINLKAPDLLEYFVPQVIKQIQLNRKKGESLTKFKYFPNQSEGKEIALYLGLKLASEGAVAIFCGRKDTASGICEMVSEIFSRDLSMTPPIVYSDHNEITKISYLIEQNIGPDTPACISAKIGIFSHHGNTPHGIRLAVEHAMRKQLIRFVVCTSTLAQGVNLPIRYLIITNIYQGLERIKVRDFHNLIGRAGRSGMHTEGSILFADPVVYDKRQSRNERWRWDIVKNLLDPSKSEECISSLSKLIPLVIRNDKSKSRDLRNHTEELDILSFAKAHIEGQDSLDIVLDRFTNAHNIYGFTTDIVRSQFQFFSNTISSIESFLLSNWDADGVEISESNVITLAKETLAYFLADEAKRVQIEKLFKLLAQNISHAITDSSRRKAFGRTLYGVNDARTIEEWLQSNVTQLLAANNEGETLNVLWPLLSKHIHNKTFSKFDKKHVLKEVAQNWIGGKHFYGLLSVIRQRNAKMIWGSQLRDFKIDHVVEICESAFAYEGALLIGALCEFLEIIDQHGANELIGRLQFFQKQLTYGLPTEAAITLYELGFSDRVISQDLSTSINISDKRKGVVINALKKRHNAATSVIQKYPEYFQDRMKSLL